MLWIKKNKSLRNAMFAHVHECMHDPNFMRNFVGRGRMTKDKCLGLSGRTKSGFNTCMATTLLGVHHLGELICDRKNLPCEFHFPSSLWEVTSPHHARPSWFDTSKKLALCWAQKRLLGSLQNPSIPAVFWRIYKDLQEIWKWERISCVC